MEMLACKKCMIILKKKFAGIEMRTKLVSGHIQPQYAPSQGVKLGHLSTGSRLINKFE
jgi:hypothetical protein